MAKQKKYNSPNILKRKVSFSYLQITSFALAFGALGVFAILQSSAARNDSLPECSISPSNPKAGDYTMDITAPLPPVPASSIEQYYRVKLQTPYNTGTLDATYDATTGTAKLTWQGELVKGKYAFYFINYDKYAEYPANSNPVRVSQTCSVNIR